MNGTLISLSLRLNFLNFLFLNSNPEYVHDVIKNRIRINTKNVMAQ